MTQPGFRIRHLVFLGPQRTPASVAFGPGLNLVYGASDTGKSFIVEAIDFIESVISDAPHMVPAYLQGQALKYIIRMWLKGNALEDARKAEWYINRLIAKLEQCSTSQG